MSEYAHYIATMMFFRSWRPMFSMLSDERAGELIKAIFAFCDGEKPEVIDELVPSYSVMTAALDDGARKCLEKRSSARQLLFKQAQDEGQTGDRNNE